MKRPTASLPAAQVSPAAALLSTLWTTFDLYMFPLNFVIYFFCWPLLEVAFYFRLRRYRDRRNAQVLQHHPEDTQSVLETFWPTVMAEDPINDIIEGWFVGEGDLRTGNVEELIAWTLYAKYVSSLDAEQKATSDALLAKVLARANELRKPWASGYNPSRRCLLHTLEPLEICWKPLLFYMLVQAARDGAWWLLRRRGFELRSNGACRYWYHPGSRVDVADAAAAAAAEPGTTASSATATAEEQQTSEEQPTEATAGDLLAPTPTPLVVLHGVGGLVPYVMLMLKLRKDQPRHPVLAPLLPHCSLFTPPFEPPPPLDTTRLVAGLAEAIQSLPRPPNSAPPPSGAARRCHFFGHSLGTAVLASIARSRPDLIASATFVDPVCFLIYRHHVVYNFLYRNPTPLRHGVRQAKHFGYWFRLALHYMLKREPTIQSCFRREFWWGRHWLHPAHLKSFPSHVVLSGRDAIVPSHLVHEYLLAFKRKTEPPSSSSSSPSSPQRHSPPSPPPPQSPQSSSGTDHGESHEATRPTLGVELHERWHHGLAIMAPFAMRRVLAPLYKLIDEAEANVTRDMTGVTPTVEEAGMELQQSQNPPPPGPKTRKNKKASSRGDEEPYPLAYKVAVDRRKSHDE